MSLLGAAMELRCTGLMYLVDRKGVIHPLAADRYAALTAEELRGCAVFVRRQSAEAWAAGFRALLKVSNVAELSPKTDTAPMCVWCGREITTTCCKQRRELKTECGERPVWKGGQS